MRQALVALAAVLAAFVSAARAEAGRELFGFAEKAEVGDDLSFLAAASDPGNVFHAACCLVIVENLALVTSESCVAKISAISRLYRPFVPRPLTLNELDIVRTDKDEGVGIGVQVSFRDHVSSEPPLTPQNSDMLRVYAPEFEAGIDLSFASVVRLAQDDSGLSVGSTVKIATVAQGPEQVVDMKGSGSLKLADLTVVEPGECTEKGLTMSESLACLQRGTGTDLTKFGNSSAVEGSPIFTINDDGSKTLHGVVQEYVGAGDNDRLLILTAARVAPAAEELYGAAVPTAAPSGAPTSAPSKSPTSSPSKAPTSSPTPGEASPGPNEGGDSDDSDNSDLLPIIAGSAGGAVLLALGGAYLLVRARRGADPVNNPIAQRGPPAMRDNSLGREYMAKRISGIV